MNTRSGLGLPTVLTVVFVVLKLTELIAWSWWLVFSPLLIVWGFALVVTLLIVLGVAIGAAFGASKLKPRKPARPQSHDPFDHPFFKNGNRR